jgi:DHA1 family tetracycline resistance protein-like MFS transporter
MRKASLGTIFLTVFLDLLGFGLVVPFLPGVARAYGASDSVATLLGAGYSLMQFLLIPFWGKLSDRFGRRPILLSSIAAIVVGMMMLGFAHSLAMLFAARLLQGAASANIAVAQAYIADVTPPDQRARGMGIIGVAFGLGFIFGPFVGGELGRFALLGGPGALAAFVAAGLSSVNFVLAWRFLPESLPPERRGRSERAASPISAERLRALKENPGAALAIGVQFLIVLAFAGMEQTFRLFTEDAFHMTVEGTGRVLGFVGVVAAIVQGASIRPLTRRYGEARLVRAGVVVQVAAFALLGATPRFGANALLALFASAGLIALGNGLSTPSVSSYVSRRSDSASQGAALGALQSAGALARVVGPATAGVVYQLVGHAETYYFAAVVMALAATLATAMQPLEAAPVAVPDRATGT